MSDNGILVQDSGSVRDNPPVAPVGSLAVTLVVVGGILNIIWVAALIYGGWQLLDLIFE